MRQLFKNLPEEQLKTTTSFAHGEVLPITQVPIESFSKKKWEDGYGLLPDGKDNRIYAPLDGVIAEISGNGNAYRIKGDNGLEVFIHLGVDTDDLGEPYFEIKSVPGQIVKTGDIIGVMDVAGVTRIHKCPVSYLLILSGEEVRLIKHHAMVDETDDGFFWCAQVDHLI